MKSLTFIAGVALVAAMFSADASAQRYAPSRVVTHSPSYFTSGGGSGSAHIGGGVTVFPGNDHYRRDHSNYPNHLFARRHYVHVHGPLCVYSPARYETQYEKYFVPGYYETQYYPPRYEYRIRNGRKSSVLVANGGYRNVYIEGYYATRPYQVSIPATWSCGYY